MKFDPPPPTIPVYSIHCLSIKTDQDVLLICLLKSDASMKFLIWIKFPFKDDHFEDNGNLG